MGHENNIVRERLTLDIVYQTTISPPIADMTIDNTVHKVVIVPSIRKKTFKARTAAEELKAIGEITEFSASRFAVTSSAGRVVFPAMADLAVIDKGISFEYTISFGNKGNIVRDTCEIPYREITIEDKNHNKITSRILTGWLAPAETGGLDAAFRLRSDFPWIYRRLQ